VPAIVRVIDGDITTFDGDAVVNAANNHLRLGTGVAGAIAKRGGGGIQEECHEIVRKNGPLKVGGAAITGAGRLKVRYVIHAAAMGDLPVTPDSIRNATRSALELAEKHDIRSLAFPVLGTGVGGFPFSEAARIMVEEVRSFLQDGGDMDLVAFYGFTPDQASTLRRYLS
jgi:O-acetyl-ADP-ribose deacetylase (regulator of RNase III)